MGTPEGRVTPALRHKPGRAGRTAPELLAPGGCGARHQNCTPQLCPVPWRGLELGVRVHSGGDEKLDTRLNCPRAGASPAADHLLSLQGLAEAEADHWHPGRGSPVPPTGNVPKLQAAFLATPPRPLPAFLFFQGRGLLHLWSSVF